ncbi:MAG: hypothetical protein Q9187_002100 [Circinaria calcarea]
MFKDLYQQFKRLTLHDYASVAEYTAAFRKNTTQLRTLHQNAVLPEAIQIIQYLEGLGAAYEIWETIYTQTHDLVGDNAVKFEVVIQAVMNEEINQRTRNGESSVALVAAGKNRRTTTEGEDVPRSDRLCTFPKCRKKGHWERDCFMKHPHLKASYEQGKGSRKRKWDERNSGR